MVDENLLNNAEKFLYTPEADNFIYTPIEKGANDAVQTTPKAKIKTPDFTSFINSSNATEPSNISNALLKGAIEQPISDNASIYDKIAHFIGEQSLPTAGAILGESLAVPAIPLTGGLSLAAGPMLGAAAGKTIQRIISDAIKGSNGEQQTPIKDTARDILLESIGQAMPANKVASNPVVSNILTPKAGYKGLNDVITPEGTLSKNIDYTPVTQSTFIDPLLEKLRKLVNYYNNAEYKPGAQQFITDFKNNNVTNAQLLKFEIDNMKNFSDYKDALKYLNFFNYSQKTPLLDLFKNGETTEKILPKLEQLKKLNGRDANVLFNIDTDSRLLKEPTSTGFFDPQNDSINLILPNSFIAAPNNTLQLARALAKNTPIKELNAESIEPVLRNPAYVFGHELSHYNAAVQNLPLGGEPEYLADYFQDYLKDVPKQYATSATTNLYKGILGEVLARAEGKIATMDGISDLSKTESRDLFNKMLQQELGYLQENNIPIVAYDNIHMQKNPAIEEYFNRFVPRNKGGKGEVPIRY